MKNTFTLLLILAITACRKEVKLKLPETASKPVVFAYISPNDTVIKVKVTRSMPLFEPFNEKNFEPYPNAKVWLSNSNKEVQLAFNSTTGQYEIKSTIFAIEYGRKYKLRVNMQNGQTAEAETMVPSKSVEITSASYAYQTMNTYSLVNVFVGYEDDPAALNRYGLFVNTLDTVGTDTTFYGAEFREFSSVPEIQGGVQQLKLSLYDSLSVKRAIGFDCYLLNCSKEYVSFYTSIYSYSGGNPFSEPLPIYSNVINGYGVFAAYTSYKKRILK